MSNRTQTCVIWILTVVLVSSCWMLYSERRKINDNLPSLTDMMQLKQRDADSKVTGYMEHQLLEVWGNPNCRDGERISWKTEDGSVTVRADSQGMITSCSISRIIDLPILYDLAYMAQDDMARSLRGRFADQVALVWDTPDSSLRSQLTWKFPMNSPHKEVAVEIDRFGIILHAEFKD